MDVVMNFVKILSFRSISIIVLAPLLGARAFAGVPDQSAVGEDKRQVAARGSASLHAGVVDAQFLLVSAEATSPNQQLHRVVLRKKDQLRRRDTKLGSIVSPLQARQETVEPMAPFTFYSQPALFGHFPCFFDSCSWGAGYLLDFPPSGSAFGITEISAISLRNWTDHEDSVPTTFDPAVVLLEFYDDYDTNHVPPFVWHSGYLGGVVLSFGRMEPGDQLAGTFVAADGAYFVTTGSDEVIFISAYAGTIIDGKFVEFTDKYSLGLGTAGDGSAHFDGNGNDPIDRIYEAGPWFDIGFLTIELRGVVLPDCNANAVPDTEELACADELGSPDCTTGTCTSFGPGSEGAFSDPLGIGYVIPAAIDKDDDGVPDTCADCDGDGVPDFQAIANGDVTDCNCNGIPDLCDAAVEPQTAIAPAKNRYLTFTVGGLTCSGTTTQQALRITSPTFVNLKLWVGEPDANGVSLLIEQAFYQDWGSGPVVVTDPDIVPEADYIVQAIAQGDDVLAESFYSFPPTFISTSTVWGDVVGPFDPETESFSSPNGITNFIDIQAVVMRFKNLSAAPPIESADLQPESPDYVVDFNDIEECVAAFRGGGYPFGLPN